jgi:hypothetical protein
LIDKQFRSSLSKVFRKLGISCKYEEGKALAPCIAFFSFLILEGDCGVLEANIPKDLGNQAMLTKQRKIDNSKTLCFYSLCVKNWVVPNTKNVVLD